MIKPLVKDDFFLDTPKRRKKGTVDLSSVKPGPVAKQDLSVEQDFRKGLRRYVG